MVRIMNLPKKTKVHPIKIVLVIFYLLAIVSKNQCCYAGLEEYYVQSSGERSIIFQFGKTTINDAIVKEMSDSDVLLIDLDVQIIVYRENLHFGAGEKFLDIILNNLSTNHSKLIKLELVGAEIEDVEAQKIAEALQKNHTLSSLRLDKNGIGPRGALAIVRALRSNNTLTYLNLALNPVDDAIQEIATLLIDNYSLLKLKLGFSDIGNISEKILLRNSLLAKLLLKIKRASAFTFTIGYRNTPLLGVLPDILELAGLNVRERITFRDIQNYNNEVNRRVIFNGNLEEVIKLFYYGNHASYEEIIREVNQIRRLQREILQENPREISAGELLDLPERLAEGVFLMPGQVRTVFFEAS